MTGSKQQKPWPIIPLGEVLTKSDEWVELKPEETYRQVTVRLWGKGVTLRGEITGAEIAASKQRVVHARQFIASRIDARNGAFGLIPDSLEGAIVTSDFPVFSLNETRMLPEYLHWLSKTGSFVELCKAASEGTTNRVRLKEDRFLALEIPLPPATEQRRIVARIEQLAAQIEEARRLRHQATEETEALFAAAAGKVFLSVKASAVPVGDTISFRNDLIRPIDGKTGEIRFIGLQHIESHTGRKIGEDRMLAEELTGRKFKFSPDEIVYGYLRPYLNKVWIADCEGYCSVDQYVILPDAEKVDTEYLAYFMRSPVFLNRAIELTHNLLLPRLRTALLESIEMPLPSLLDQRRIVGYLDGLAGQVAALARLQSETAAELDALLPSVLDKAFKGEL